MQRGFIQIQMICLKHHLLFKSLPHESFIKEVVLYWDFFMLLSVHPFACFSGFQYTYIDSGCLIFNILDVCPSFLICLWLCYYGQLPLDIEHNYILLQHCEIKGLCALSKSPPIFQTKVLLLMSLCIEYSQIAEPPRIVVTVSNILRFFISEAIITLVY